MTGAFVRDDDGRVRLALDRADARSLLEALAVDALLLDGVGELQDTTASGSATLFGRPWSVTVTVDDGGVRLTGATARFTEALGAVTITVDDAALDVAASGGDRAQGGFTARLGPGAARWPATATVPPAADGIAWTARPADLAYRDLCTALGVAPTRVPAALGDVGDRVVDEVQLTSASGRLVAALAVPADLAGVAAWLALERPRIHVVHGDDSGVDLDATWKPDGGGADGVAVEARIGASGTYLEVAAASTPIDAVVRALPGGAAVASLLAPLAELRLRELALSLPAAGAATVSIAVAAPGRHVLGPLTVEATELSIVRDGNGLGVDAITGLPALGTPAPRISLRRPAAGGWAVALEPGARVSLPSLGALTATFEAPLGDLFAGVAVDVTTLRAQHDGTGFRALALGVELDPIAFTEDVRLTTLALSIEATRGEGWQVSGRGAASVAFAGATGSATIAVDGSGVSGALAVDGVKLSALAGLARQSLPAFVPDVELALAADVATGGRIGCRASAAVLHAPAWLIVDRLELDASRTAAGAPWSVGVTLSSDPSRPTGSAALIAAVAHELGADVTVPFPDVRVERIAIVHQAGAVTRFTAAGAMALELAGARPTATVALELARTTTGATSSLTASVTGTVAVATQTLALAATFGTGERRVELRWKADAGATLSPRALLAGLGIDGGDDAWTLPGVDALDGAFDALHLGELVIAADLAARSVALAAFTRDRASVVLLAAPAPGPAGGWAFAVGVQGRELVARIPGVGELLDAFGLVDLTLVAASRPLPNVRLPGGVALPAAGGQLAPPTAGPAVAVPQGLSAVATLAFDRGLLLVAGEVLGVKQLAVTLSTDGSQVALAALLGDAWRIGLGPDAALTLTRPTLRVQGTGASLSVTVAGSLAVRFDGQELVATPRLTIGTDGIVASATVSLPPVLRPRLPYLYGTELVEASFELGAVFQPPGVELGFAGKARLAGVADSPSFACAIVLELIEEVPNLRYVGFEASELTLAIAWRAVTGEAPPWPTSLLDGLVARDVAIHYAQADLLLPDGTQARRGVALAGFVSIFGVDAFASLDVGATRMRGAFVCDPVHLAGVFSITGNGAGASRRPGGITTVTRRPAADAVPVVAPGGPSLTFDATVGGVPTLDGQVRVELLGLVADVTARADASGLAFALAVELGTIASFTLGCRFDARGGLHAEAEARVGVDTKVSLLGVDIPIDVGVDVTLALDVTRSGVRLAGSGWFDFEGARLGPVAFAVGADFRSFADLPRVIERAIVDAAEELFADVLAGLRELAEDVEQAVGFVADQAEAAAGAIADGATAAAEAVGRAATEAFDSVTSAAAAAAAATTEVLARGAEEVKAIAARGVEEAGKLAREAAAVARRGVEEVSRIARAAAAEVAALGAEIAELAGEARRYVERVLAAAREQAKRILDAGVRAVRAILAEAARIAGDLLAEARAIWAEIARLAEELEEGLETVGRWLGL